MIQNIRTSVFEKSDKHTVKVDKHIVQPVPDPQGKYTGEHIIDPTPVKVMTLGIPRKSLSTQLGM